MHIRCKNKQLYALDTENDWNEENTEVYMVQAAIVSEDYKEMLYSVNPKSQSRDDIVKDRINIINNLIEKALQIDGCTFVYVANLKHEAEFIKEGLKVIQQQYDISYLRKDSQMLQIYIKLSSTQALIFHDVLALYPSTSVKKLGKLFNLPKLDGFEFKPGWSKPIDLSSPGHTAYCYRDAEITYKAAKELQDKDLAGVTMTSVAWKKCKTIFNGDNPRSPTWNSYFPRLDKEIDEFLRPAYIGGINYSDPNYVAPPDGFLVHEDAKSMYPSVGVYDPLPYGYPIYYGSTRPNGLWVCKGYFRLSILPNQPDYLNLHTRIPNEDGTYTLTLTSIDYEIIHEIYSVTYEEITTYVGFKSTVGLLKQWFLAWYHAKEYHKSNNDPVQETFSKYMLNSLTGRFGLRRELTNCILSEDWITVDKTTPDGEPEENDDSYLPYVMFMTAHARRRLITHARGFDPLIHMDTDSTIGYRRGPPFVYINALGGWGLVSMPKTHIEGGFKRYFQTHFDGSYSMAAAGVPQKSDANDVPIGMWIEILDNPQIIKEHGYELGQEHYCVKSPWLRKILQDGGYNPDDIDTRKLMPKKAFGGYIYVPTTMKLNDNMVLRWG